MGVSRWAARRIWDSAAYHLLIKKRGRVPAGDSLIAKRVAGPGLGSRYFLAIGPEQAIATLEARLELDELAAFQQRAEKLIGEPQRQFRYYFLIPSYFYLKYNYCIFIIELINFLNKYLIIFVYKF